MRHFLRLLVVFLLCFVAETSIAQNSKWQDVYTVQKKDTQYGISKRYGITVEELIEANPEMKDEKYKLKKGATIYIPFHKEPVVEVEKPMKTKPGQTIRVGVMLPLHDVDGDGKRMVEYYRGLLMGCDSLRSQGVNTEIHAFNVPIDGDIRLALLGNKMENMDIIFGPLYTRQVNHIADFCRRNEIKLVIPFSINANDVLTNPYVYQVYQQPALQAEKSADAFVHRFADSNTIIIDCNDSTSNKGVFTSTLRRRLEANGMNCQITNLNSPMESFAKAFNMNKRNVVVLNTGRSPELNLAFRKLNELTANNPTLIVSMYGYNDWLMYEKTYKELFHKYDTYIPAQFYYNASMPRIQSIEANYKRWFHTEMQQRYIPRFAITGYDHAQFFIRGLFEKGSAFNGESGQSSYNAIQTPLKFVRAAADGGMQNDTFQMIHYRADKQIETIAY